MLEAMWETGKQEAWTGRAVRAQLDAERGSEASARPNQTVASFLDPIGSNGCPGDQLVTYPATALAATE